MASTLTMTHDTQETAVLPTYTPRQALQEYRQSTPVVSVTGLCYAAPEYVKRLQQEGLPYKEGFHLTLVEGINTALRSAAKNNYDFILMAGPQKSQLEDIVKMAQAQFFSDKRSPLYVLGEMHPKTFGLLRILGPKYGLSEILTIHEIHELLELKRD